MVFQAKILYFTFWGLWLYRVIVEKIKDRLLHKETKIPLYAQVLLHTSTQCFVLFFIFGCLLYNSLHETITCLTTYDWLNPAKFNSTAPSAEREIPYWLRAVSFGTPVATLITFCFSAFHVAAHAYTNGQDFMTGQRDRCMQVLALPMVYGTMSFKSVLRFWSLYTGAVSDTFPGPWEAQKAHILDLSEANYDTGDLYEAWALYQFGQLCLYQIERAFKNKPEVGELMEATKSLTTLGVATFVITCFLQATYKIAISMYENITNVVLDTKNIAPYFTGMGLISSSVAITNVVKVELGFHHELTSIRPASKFWSTKVLVSIAFMQEIVIDRLLVSFLTDLERQLLYSSLICYEIVAITGLHWVAWHIDEQYLFREKDGSFLLG